MASVRTPTVLGRLSPAAFLTRHWQRRPLRVGQAFPGLEPPIAAEELCALARREDVESRLVWRSREGRWRLRHGPFGERDLARLGPSGWTLLVQEVERYSGAVAALQRPFGFLPNWRFDDVMVSYAVPGGGIGAHVDRYDVFLVQALGRRRWRIGTRPVADERLVHGSEVRVLSDFAPDREWVLEPGDMLYVPPGIAHEGMALDPCMTFSIGFRAPSVRDALASFLGAALETVDPELLYEDRGRRVRGRDAGRIDAATVAEFSALLRHVLEDEARLRDWLGAFLTAPRRERAEPRRRDAGRWVGVLAAGGSLRRASRCSWAWATGENGGATLWVSGVERRLARDLARAAPLLADSEVLDRARLGRYLGNADFVSLVSDLVAEGELVLESQQLDGKAPDARILHGHVQKSPDRRRRARGGTRDR